MTTNKSCFDCLNFCESPPTWDNPYGEIFCKVKDVAIDPGEDCNDCDSYKNNPTSL